MSQLPKIIETPIRSGGFIPIRAELKLQLEHLDCMGNLDQTETVHVKVGVDGTRLTHNNSVCIYTVESISTATDIGLVGAVKGGDGRDDMAQCGAPFFQQLEEIDKNPVIQTDIGDIPIELRGGGDLCNLYTQLVLSAATAKYCCPLCICPKGMFWATAINPALLHDCNSHGLGQTRGNIMNEAIRSKPAFSVKNMPQTPLPRDPNTLIIKWMLLCTLHMDMRICGFLIRGIKLACAAFTGDDLVKVLQELFRVHGIYIKFFQSAKRGRGTVSFTPLRGVASRKALAIMGDVILESMGVFDPRTQTMLGLLWKETSSLLSALRNGSKADAEAIKAAGSQWLRNVVACGDAGLRGFEKDRITPYGHLIGTHGYEFVKQLGPMGKFSGEKLEALNDSFKMGQLRQTNGRDLHASILVQKRKEIAMRREAERRQKQNAQKVPKLGCQGPYRGYIAKEMALQRKSASAAATAEATARYASPYDTMSSSQLREEYESVAGKKTRLRAPSSLIANLQYEEAITGADENGFCFTSTTTAQLLEALEVLTHYDNAQEHEEEVVEEEEVYDWEELDDVEYD